MNKLIDVLFFGLGVLLVAVAGTDAGQGFVEQVAALLTGAGVIFYSLSEFIFN